MNSTASSGMRTKRDWIAGAVIAALLLPLLPPSAAEAAGDFATGTTLRVSEDRSTGEDLPGYESAQPSTSDDGLRVVFARAVEAGAPTTELWVHDRTEGAQPGEPDDPALATTYEIPVTGDVGVSLTGELASPTVSGDGNRIAFLSNATNLALETELPSVEPGEEAPWHLFVHDLQNGATWVVDPVGAGLPPQVAADRPTLSVDGSIVAFATAESIDEQDANGAVDVYVAPADPGGGAQVASRHGDGVAGGGSQPVLSWTGRWVAFTSTTPFRADSTIDALPLDAPQVWMIDLLAAEGWPRLISSPDGSTAGDGESGQPDLSRDEEGVPDVAFWTTAKNVMEPAGAFGTQEVLRWRFNGEGGDLAWVEGVAGPDGASILNSAPSISHDGETVAFERSYLLIEGAIRDEDHQVLVRDMVGGETVVASVDQSGAPGALRSAEPWIATDGTVAAFASLAPLATEGNELDELDVFIRTSAPEPPPDGGGSLQAQASFDAPLHEGVSGELTASIAGPPGEAPIEWQVDWGDGREPSRGTVGRTTVEGVATTIPVPTTYAARGTYTATLIVTDPDSLQTVRSAATAWVQNVEPAITAFTAEPSGSVQVGQEVTYHVTFTDAQDVGDYTVTFDWGDGTVSRPVAVTGSGGTWGASAVHTFSAASPADAPYQVRVTASDGQGSSSSTLPTTVTPAPDAAPTTSLTRVGEGTIAEGDQVELDLGIDDEALSSPYTVAVAWGDGLAETREHEVTALPASIRLAHTYRDDAAAVAADVTSAGSVAAQTAQLPLTVANVSPALEAPPEGPRWGVVAGEPATLELRFTDPGWEDAHTAAVTAEVPADGGTTTTSPTPSTTFADGVGTIRFTQDWSEAGLYAVDVLLNDDDGGEALQRYLVEVAPPPAVTVGTVALSVTDEDGVGPASVGAGALEVPITAIPPSAVAGQGVEASPLYRTPLYRTPLYRTPLYRTPLYRTPLYRTPLYRTGIESLPLDQIALSTVPLLRDGGWPKLLTDHGGADGAALAALPLQTVTLGDVAALTPNPLLVLEAGEVDLAATPLKDSSLSALMLGDTPLSKIPFLDANGGLTSDWCVRMLEEGFDCSAHALTNASSLLALEFAGAPVDVVDLVDVPLWEIESVQTSPLYRTPLYRTPLYRTDITASRIGAIPLYRTPLYRTGPSGTVELTAIGALPLYRTPLLEQVVDCTKIACEDQSKTLADAFAAGALLPTATLAMLLGGDGLALPELEGYTIGQLLDDLRQAADTAGIHLNLNDLFFAILDAEDYPWEELPLGELPLSSLAPFHTHAPLTYRVDVTASGTADATARFTLPKGFTPASATYPDGVTVPHRVDGSHVVVGPFAVSGSGATTVLLQARPGVLLGDHTAEVEVTIGGSSGSDTGASVRVTEHLEDAPGVADALATASDRLYVSHIASEGDVDYFRIPVAEGQRISVRLASPGVDSDLVMYRPVDPDEPQQVPLYRTGLDALPLEDEGHGGDAGGTELPPEMLQDVPVEVTPLYRTSANRGVEEESVEMVATDADAALGGYVIQVTGYNGATSEQPYVLRVRVSDPPEPLVCTPTFARPEIPAPLAQPWDAPAIAAAVPEGATTLFLLNEHRMRRLLPAEEDPAIDAMLGEVADLTGAPLHGITGAVVPLDDISSVVDAYGRWDAAYCDPEAANGVVDAIAQVVADIRSVRPTVEHVVVVGGDDAVPFARLPDTTRLNERSYADAVGDPNPIASAFATEHLLSDEPYGDAEPQAWLNRALYVSDIAVGRLVESPGDIADQLALFDAEKGYLDPATAFVTGYDFLTDGAEAVNDALAEPRTTRRSFAMVPPRIDETWTVQDIRDVLFPAQGEGPDVASVNAHYDHARSLPAKPHDTGSEDPAELFTIDDVATNSGRLSGRVLFTMGCHAGLAMPDRYVGAQADLAGDWASTFGAERAVYVANTGYGYGDSTAVALSERLMAGFADRLDGRLTVGAALAAAKHAYVGTMGVYGSYDEKVVQQTVLYGLPMYRIGEPPAEATEPPAEDGGGTTTDPLTGLEVAPTGFSDTATPMVRSTAAERGDARGDYWYVPGHEPLVTHWRPIQPKAVVDVTRPGRQARGALITGLGSTDELGFDPVFARPAVGPSANEPEITFGGVAFPARITDLTTSGGPEGHRDRLVLMPGQFVSRAASDADDVQRRYTRIDALVYYDDADTSDVAPPAFSRALATAAADGTDVGFSVDVQDDAAVKRVLVLLKDASGLWRALDLAASLDGSWEGGIAADLGGDPANPVLEWFVQAVDSSGNVAVSTNKGVLFPAQAYVADPGDPTGGEVPSGGTPAPSFAGDLGSNGWYLDEVLVTTGAEQQTVTAEGINEVVVGGATYFVPIDRTVPAAALQAPSEASTFELGATTAARFTCADAVSGVASCTAQAGPTGGSMATLRSGDPLPTATTGEHTITVTAVDRAGHRTSATTAYQVVPPPPPTEPVTSGSPAASGWYLQPLTLSFAERDEVAIDGETPELVDGEITLGDGVYDIVVTGPDGTSLTRTYRVDTTAPKAAITSPAEGARFPVGSTAIAEFGCDQATGAAERSDDGSCTALLRPAGTTGGQPVASGASIDTSTPGTYELVVTATDAAGNEGRATRRFDVGNAYRFTAWRPPVDAQPVLNRAKAGSTVPVKWQVRAGDDGSGDYVRDLAGGTVRSIRTIACASSAPTSEVEGTLVATTSEVTYDHIGEQYVWEWKTDKAFAKSPDGPCRRLTLRLPDGQEAYADFEFR